MVFVRQQLLPVFGLLALLIPSLPAQQQRIRYRIDDEDPRPTKGNIRPAVANGLARDQGEVSGSHIVPRMYLHFALTPAQQADLDQLLKAQQNRRSPQYRRFLSPHQYAARFGLNPADLAKVINWLEDNGFSSLQVAQSRTWISFSGTAAQAASAFHTSLHHYSLHGESHIANATEPSLPAALSRVVKNITGLHNFPWKSRARPLYTTGAGGHFLVPDDWATIYNVKPLYGTGLDGSGATIAVVGQTNIKLTDIQAFRSAAGLPPNNPTIVVPSNARTPGVVANEESEADLDLEWAGAIAPKAHIIFVTASTAQGNGVFDSLAYTIDQNLADVVSVSYGGCEADLAASDVQTFNSMFQQASAQGMTIVAASGDLGVATCDGTADQTAASHAMSVDFPASSPNVTGIGGTEFDLFSSDSWNANNNSVGGSAVNYIPENGWNEGFHSASGGGASTLYAKPAWQAGTGVPDDNARDVPDLAFIASPNSTGLLICTNGSCANGFVSSSNYVTVIGGTSAGAPPFAGILALLVQKGAGTRLGNINPNLYSLAQISNNAFHDIVNGDNNTPCLVGTAPGCLNGSFGFSAGPGYDQVTGLGSLDAYQFVEQWNGDIQISADPTSLTILPGTSATATITVGPQNNFSGPITFSCLVKSYLVDVTCSVAPNTVNTSGTAVVTITAAITARVLPLGKYRPLPPIGNCWLPLLGVLGSTLLSFWYWRPVHRRPALYGTALASILIIAVISCGGSASGGGSQSNPANLTVSCTLPANAMAGSNYTGSCSALGGTGVLTFSVISGSLPDGIYLNASTGAITGSPINGGTSSFTVQVIDGASHTASIAETLSVAPGSLYSSCSSEPASVDKLYSAYCGAFGGTPPFTWSLTSGMLPPGLTLNPQSGQISGVPTSDGTFSFVATARDSSNPILTANAASTLAVYATPDLVYYCYSISGNVGLALQLSCYRFGGNPPFSYSIIKGTLPPGVSLVPAYGVTEGAPQQEGVYSFSIQATDGSTPPKTATTDLKVTVGPRESEQDRVIITATSGAIVNTVGINVYVPQRTTP